MALRNRLNFQPGGVLVLGATGNAGRLAVQIAKLLGAERVVGAGRSPERLHLLKDLGADAVVPLDGSGEEVTNMLGREAGDVDVVLDCLWGRPTEQAIPAILIARTDRSKALHWVQVGSMASQGISLSSAFSVQATSTFWAAVRDPSVPTPSWPNCPRSPMKSAPAR
ncbi:zinc-binding dehydrogenase [Streptomyces fractus]|uniref:zinc-binding dehydrogenase n=1 Tax=Streptomyces fractus TaxID=641806 RepID=UPI003CEC578B